MHISYWWDILWQIERCRIVGVHQLPCCTIFNIVWFAAVILMPLDPFICNPSTFGSCIVFNEYICIRSTESLFASIILKICCPSENVPAMHSSHYEVEGTTLISINWSVIGNTSSSINIETTVFH
jgi:hypothetical protein